MRDGLRQSVKVCSGLTGPHFVAFAFQTKEDKSGCYQVQKQAAVIVRACVRAHGIGNFNTDTDFRKTSSRRLFPCLF